MEDENGLLEITYTNVTYIPTYKNTYKHTYIHKHMKKIQLKSFKKTVKCRQYHRSQGRRSSKIDEGAELTILKGRSDTHGMLNVEIRKKRSSGSYMNGE